MFLYFIEGLFKCRMSCYLYYEPDTINYIHDYRVQQSGLSIVECAKYCQSHSTFNCQAYTYRKSDGKLVHMVYFKEIIIQLFL